jgi:gamma-glutamyltranspeptidase
LPLGVATPDQDSGANFLEPNKRPLSLSAPLMIVSSAHMCKNRFISAAPSFDVLTQVAASHFLFDKPVGDSVYMARLHLGTPFGSRDYLTELHEPYLSSAMVSSLESRGVTFSVLKGPYQSCHAIMKYEEALEGQADPRTDSQVSSY